TPIARPLLSTEISRKYEPGLTSHRPVFSAAGITLDKLLDLAPRSQPYHSQKPQWLHACRPWYGCERIAEGTGTGCSSNFLQPRSKRTPADFIGKAGSGYAFERGDSNGLAPPTP